MSRVEVSRTRISQSTFCASMRRNRFLSCLSRSEPGPPESEPVSKMRCPRHFSSIELLIRCASGKSISIAICLCRPAFILSRSSTSMPASSSIESRVCTRLKTCWRDRPEPGAEQTITNSLQSVIARDCRSPISFTTSSCLCSHTNLSAITPLRSCLWSSSAQLRQMSAEVKSTPAGKGPFAYASIVLMPKSSGAHAKRVVRTAYPVCTPLNFMPPSPNFDPNREPDLLKVASGSQLAIEVFGSRD